MNDPDIYALYNTDTTHAHTCTHTERDRETYIQTYIQIDTHTDRETYTYTDRHTHNDSVSGNLLKVTLIPRSQ